MTDTFSFAPEPKVDLLFVLDDSCSMGEELGRLRAGVAELFAVADGRGSDYQVAATDTTVTGDDLLYQCSGYPAIVGYDDPDRDDALDCLLDMPLDGTGIERGAHGGEADPRAA